MTSVKIVKSDGFQEIHSVEKSPKKSHFKYGFFQMISGIIWSKMIQTVVGMDKAQCLELKYFVQKLNIWRLCMIFLSFMIPKMLLIQLGTSKIANLPFYEAKGEYFEQK